MVWAGGGAGTRPSRLPYLHGTQQTAYVASKRATLFVGSRFKFLARLSIPQTSTGGSPVMTGNAEWDLAGY